MLVWLVIGWGLLLGVVRAGQLNATFHTATSVPVTASSFTATSNTVNFTLNFAPAVGTELTVVKNTGLGFINGVFSNLAQGQAVTLNYGGVSYGFVANYYGGTGNDLVLVWKNNRALAWGDNGKNSLGDGTTIDRRVPVPVSTAGVLSGKTVVAVAEGAYHTLALCSDGTLAAWGNNTYGQLGDTTTTQRATPVAVFRATGSSALFGKTVVAIAAGTSHSLALCSDGTVAAWGEATRGQLGNNSSTNRVVPVPVLSSSGASALYGKTVVGIAAGAYHSLARCSDGTVAAWGDNSRGQLGDTTTTTRSAPVAVNRDAGISAMAGRTVVAIAAGAEHSMALCTEGPPVMWGANTYGQLGDTSTTDRLVPVDVHTASGSSALYSKTVAAVAGGASHTLALCTDGTLTAWGRNSTGQLGDTTQTQRVAPVRVNTSPGISILASRTVTAIAAGASHSVAQCSDGTVAAWGYNLFGQLGDNTTTLRPAPVAVNTSALGSGERFIQASTGQASSFTLSVAASVPASGPSVAKLTPGTLIGNGSFESGDFSGWIVSDLSRPYKPLQVRPNGYNPGFDFFSSTATDGALSATHGFDGSPGTIRIAHEVAVTAAEPFLRFDYRVAWDMETYNGSTLARTFAVTILPSGGGAPLQSAVFVTAGPGSKNLDTGALSGAVDLTAYIGTTIRVSFDAMIPEDGTGPGFFQLDNVRTAALLDIAALTPGTLVSNGSFETGDFVNWIVSDIASPLERLQVKPDGYSPGFGLFASQATDGVLSAVHGFDGAGPGSIRLAHEVTVTSGEPFLRFDYRVGWDMEGYDSTQPRTIAVSILPSGGGTALQSTVIVTAASGSESLDSGPKSGVVDLSAYIGTTIRVSFDATIPENQTGPGFFQLDNVRTAALLLPLPTATTGLATAVTAEKVTLHGVVNAHGPSTVVTFEYGHHLGYGFTANATPSPVNDNGDTAVSAILSGLQPGTTYHYRVKAVSANGTAHGSDMTFTTLTEVEDWRFAYFGITTNTGDAADEADPDGDGQTNLFEFVAGLVPNDPASQFALRIESVAGEPGQKAVVFGPVLGGRTYVVKYKASMTDETWQELTNSTTTNNGSEWTVTDLDAGTGARFYEVEITKP